jgi:hypothetical protein
MLVSLALVVPYLPFRRPVGRLEVDSTTSGTGWPYSRARAGAREPARTRKGPASPRAPGRSLPPSVGDGVNLDGSRWRVSP